MGRRQDISGWIFVHADFVPDEHVLHVGIDMVKVEFLDGTEETIESKDGYQAFHYLDLEKAYVVRRNDEEVHFPKEFVKSIRHIKV